MPKISLFVLPAALLLSCASHCSAQFQIAAPAPATTEATLYSTLPSTAAHRPEMALDGDDSTYFKSAYGMDEGDDFTVFLSRPVAARSIRISTGSRDGDDLLTDGVVEISPDGQSFRPAATFNAQGMASAPLNGRSVAALRIKLKPGSGLPSLIVREISLDSPLKISHVAWGAGRAFSDVSRAPDLQAWAQKAEREMDEFWPDAAALLYSDGFITPNKVNVIYLGGADVTPVAATGSGVMTVNVAWARAHPEDTGLTVHEMAHVVQAMSAYDPVWLIEGIADYVRWVKFEPQNFTFNLNPAKATYHDSYRTTAAFLAWCELHYDSRLVSKLNREVRTGTYKTSDFKTFCGKDVDALWSEFLAAYQADRASLLAAPVALADRPRALPVVTAGSSVAVDLSRHFNALGITRDGAAFGAASGFDAGGAAFSGDLLGTSLTTQNVRFSLGTPGQNNIVAAHGNVISLPGQKFSSLWLLGAAVEGSQRGQNLAVTYADGTTQNFSQNLSDWFAPQQFSGEIRALKTAHRNLLSGAQDARPFSLYAYGFALDGAKTVRSLTLPDAPNVKIVGVTLAN